jgi:3'-5' exoribonuclease
MYSQLLAEISTVQEAQIKALLENVFNDKEIAEKFKNHPGAIEVHHNWVGGLLEHCLEVLEYCKTSHKNFPMLNRDLLVAGALLHDIGKLEEIEVTARIKGTKKGQLTGHLVLGTIFIANKCDEVKMDFETKDKMLHIMVSHHGTSEYGSPKEPMFPEALAVYYADDCSCKLAEMVEFILDSKGSTEDEFMYNKRHSKNILLK